MKSVIHYSVVAQGLLVLCLLLMPPTSRAQTDTTSWILRDPVNVNLNGVAYGLNRFIAVGNHGYWFTSPNGQTWTVRTPMTDKHLTAVHFAHGRFVTVGDGIYITTNGVTWQKASLSTTRLALTDVAADNAGNWLAVGRMIQPDGALGPGVTLTSTDGANWTRKDTFSTPGKIAFGAGQWFGAGGGFSGDLLVQWINLEAEPGNPPEYQWQVVQLDDFELPQPTGSLIRFLNGRFILCGFNSADDPMGAHHVFTSSDGLVWPKGSVTNQGLPENGANQPRFSVMQDITYGDGIYLGVAAGSYSFNSDTWLRADAMTSTDGVNWAFIDRTSLSQASNRGLAGITHANGQFVAVGYRGTSPQRNNVATTPDGLTWTSRGFNSRVFQRSANETAVAIASGNGQVVAVTQYGGAAVSEDRGIIWGYAEVTAGSLSLEAVAHGGNRFVAVGSQGWAYRSTDGYSWSSVQVPDAYWLHSVVHDGGQFLAAGQYRNAGNTVRTGIVSRSADGLNWTTVHLPESSRIDRVAFGNGLYVAQGSAADYLVFVSADAVNWTRVTNAPALMRLTFGGGRFLGSLGSPGQPQFYTSTNGTDWILLEAADEFSFPPWFTPITLNFLNGHFVMGGNEIGVFFLENDRWVERGGPAHAALAYAEDTYVATSLWTYRPLAAPSLEPPTLLWEVIGDYLRLRFSAQIDHRYRLWERSGLGEGSAWIEVNSLTAQVAEAQFEIPVQSQPGQVWLYQLSVEPPATP